MNNMYLILLAFILVIYLMWRTNNIVKEILENTQPSDFIYNRLNEINICLGITGLIGLCAVIYHLVILANQYV